MKVNIAVCGRFHYGKTLKYLDAAGKLNRFYHSSRLGRDQEYFGGRFEQSRNLWLKEYLMFGHARVVGATYLHQGLQLYEAMWRRSVLRNWSKADIFHYLLHGNCQSLIDRARQDGSIVIGEPVNSHPVVVDQLMNDEHDLLKLPRLPARAERYEKFTREAQTSDYLLCASEFVRQSFVQQGFDGDKTLVLPFSGDLTRFYPDETPARADEKFKVICVGGAVAA